MLGVGPTYGRPMGLIRRPLNALLTRITSHIGKMKNAKGQDGLGPSTDLAFRSSERASAIRRERKRASVAEFSSRQSEARAALAALFHDVSTLTPFS